MTSFPGSPKLLKGGLVLIDPETAKVQRIISLQYNPDTLSRTLQIKGVGEGGDRSEALRLKGPPVETIKLEAEKDGRVVVPPFGPWFLSAQALARLRQDLDELMKRRI